MKWLMGAGRLARASAFGLLVFVELVPRTALAVPVFARKYATSCQTCHVAFPKLTPFGDAFRRNGYRFPAGDDEDARKDAVIEMGQEAHKKIFPEAVWPGDLPATLPLAAQMAMQVLVTPNAETKASFAGIGGTFGLNLALTAGEWFSAWAGTTVRAAPNPAGGETFSADLERVFIVISPFDQTSMNLRVGRFEPGIFGFSAHRTLGPAPWIGSSTVRDNRFTPEPTQLGFESAGVFGSGRATYALGVVEGSGNRIDSTKDVYARLGAKLGGMRLDGVGGTKETEPWRESSVQVGTFFYRGWGSIGDPALATQLDPFWSAGADTVLTWRDASLTLAFARGHNERPRLSDPTRPTESWHAFSQLDYVVYPWLIPTLRYEHRQIGKTGGDRMIGSVFVLLRANVRAQLIAVTELQQGSGGPQSRLSLTQVLAGLNAAF